MEEEKKKKPKKSEKSGFKSFRDRSFYQMEEMYMEFFASAVDTLKVLVMAIGCGLGAWI